MIHPLKNFSRLGLIADSHGSAYVLENAIAALQDQQVDQIVHLGDFCDSQSHDHLGEIFELMVRHHVLAVKGNNDYQVEKMIENSRFSFNAGKRKQWLTFLQKIPIIRRFDLVCCCHSMPFESIRAFYDPVDTGGTAQAAGIFRNTEDAMIFCGHSHTPVIFRHRKGYVVREPLKNQASTALSHDDRYIIVVGAAENHECAVFDLNAYRYERIDISASMDQGINR